VGNTSAVSLFNFHALGVFAAFQKSLSPGARQRERKGGEEMEKERDKRWKYRKMV
jgi:hypothetical protein